MSCCRILLCFMGALCLQTAASAQILGEKDVSPAVLMIETAPQAEVFLDDVFLGRASLHGDYTVQKVSSGSHLLRVTDNDKIPFVQKILVAAGKTIRVRAQLANLVGDLEVLTTPEAEVFIDGRSAGVADSAGKLKIPGLVATSHKIRAGRAGYNSGEADVRLAANTLNSVTLDLKLIEAADSTAAAGSTPNYVLHRSLPLEQNRWYETHLFFLSSGLRLVSTHDDGRIIQWEPSSGRQLNSRDVNVVIGKNRPYFPGVSPDLRWAAVGFESGNEYFTRLTEIETGRIVEDLSGAFRGFTPDSKQVITRVNRKSDLGSPDLQFWDAQDGKPSQTWHDASDVVFTPSGTLAVVCGSGHSVTIRKVEAGQTVGTLHTKTRGCKGDISSDGHWLALVDTEQIEMWNVATGRQGRTIELSKDSIDEDFPQVVFTADGRYLITAGKGYLYAWDTFSGLQIGKWSYDGYVRRLTASPDGQWLAGISPNGITLWRRTEEVK